MAKTDPVVVAQRAGAFHLQINYLDSWFDAYRGVIVLVRVMQGTLRKGQRIRFMSNGKMYEVDSMGVLMPKPVEIAELRAGEVGFFAATIKNVADTKIGDTVTDVADPATEQLPGFDKFEADGLQRSLSSDITATAPASSAIFACSAFTTSMITPPFCIAANPRLRSSVPCMSSDNSIWFLLSFVKKIIVKLAVSERYQIWRRLPRCFTNRSQFHGSSSTFTVTCSIPQTPCAFLLT